MNKFEQKSYDEMILDVSSESRTVKACWSRLGNVDLDNDIIVAEAFTKTIAERGPKGKNLIWSLIDHKADMSHTIGKPIELYIEGDMLVAITEIVETEAGEDVIKLYEAGLINQHSIGFSTLKSSVNKDTQVRTITELKLYEGSAVLWGANPETPTLGFKSELSTKESLSQQLENLIKAFRGGTFTDDTFALMEIQIKRIQAELLELEIVKEFTQPAEAVEPTIEVVEEKSNEDVIKAIHNFNNLFKK